MTADSIVSLCDEVSKQALEGRVRGVVMVYVDAKGDWRCDSRNFSLPEAIGFLFVGALSLGMKMIRLELSSGSSSR